MVLPRGVVQPRVETMFLVVVPCLNYAYWMLTWARRRVPNLAAAGAKQTV